MAIPLIIGVGAAALGLYKGAKAIIDNNDANEINESAQSIVQDAERRLENSREECQKALTDLGQRKVDTLQLNVKNFLDAFNKIQNVEFQRDGGLDNLNLREFDTNSLTDMAESVSFVLSSGLGVTGGAVSGALTAFGAYSGTMAFAAAGTGTAISSLSGAAATNATLAWLGGGTLASGGMGVAGGTIALGALAAGPALLVAGWYMGSKAEGKLNDARSNKEQAEKFAADMNVSIALTTGIRNVAAKANDILSELRKHARRNLNELISFTEAQGFDYRNYSVDAKTCVMKNVKVMQVIKAVLDTPILDTDGHLLGDAAIRLDNCQKTISNDFKGELTF